MMTFLIKANSRLIDKAFSKQELRAKVSAYEQTLQGRRYKKEYCFFEEADGTHYGYHFTLFDEDEQMKRLAELEERERSIYAAHERGELSDEALEFELQGIAMSESLIINLPY